MSNRRRLRLVPSLHASKALSNGTGDRPGEMYAALRSVPPAGAVNGYVCRVCQKLTMVEHVDAGATPMQLACLATEDCEGSARSIMYPDQKNIPERIRAAVKWQWYRPDKVEYAQLSPEMKHHVSQGGLVLRKKE